jgi:hypothetical protein
LVLVWVWSLEWSYIPSWVDVFWRVFYKIYNWERVITKLEEDIIKNISSKLDWTYFRLDELWKIEKLEEIIFNNTEKSILKKDIENRLDLTRYIIVLAFLFWIMFLWNISIAKFKK